MEPEEIKVEVGEFNEEKETTNQDFLNYSPEMLNRGDDAVNKSKTQNIKKENNTDNQSGSENERSYTQYEIQQPEGGKKPEEKRRRGGRPKKSDFEKKQKQTERARRFRAKNVNIGDQVERWAFIKCMTNTDTHSDLAKLLIDFYVQHHPALAMIPGNPLTKPGHEGSCIANTEEDSNNGEAGFLLRDCKIKTEVTEGENFNDTVYNRNEHSSRIPEIEVHSNTDEIKVETEDSEYNKALSTTNSETSRYCHHDNTANTGQSPYNVPKVTNRQGKNLQEKKRSGNSKRKGLSDAISYLKVKKLKEIQ